MKNNVKKKMTGNVNAHISKNTCRIWESSNSCNEKSKPSHRQN